jgi:hypothetical protein
MECEHRTRKSRTCAKKQSLWGRRDVKKWIAIAEDRLWKADAAAGDGYASLILYRNLLEDIVQSLCPFLPGYTFDG